MNNQIGIIHVTDDMVKAGMAGASVSWELVDEVDHEDLCFRLKGAGLTHSPEPSTPAAALSRVMNDLYANRSCLVRTVPNPNGTKQPAYGVLPRKDDKEKNKVAFIESWACGIDKDSSGSASLFFSESAPYEEREALEVLFPAACATLGRLELSCWLTAFVKAYLRGVPTVGGAGTYFICPDEVPVWRKLRDLLKVYGIRLYEIPAMKSEQALECIIESVRRFTASACEELQVDLDKYRAMRADPDPKKRAIQGRVLDTRLTKITEQLAIVEKYEVLFDTKLEELRGTLAGLNSGFTLLASGALTE